MHLTNYAVNKKASQYRCTGEGDDSNEGHKRCLAHVWDQVAKQGFSPERVKGEINDLIIKTLCSVKPVVTHLLKSSLKDEFTNKSCFEILGFDILLDSEARPWLLEVNHSPSFRTETKFDLNLKEQLIRDTLHLVSISQRTKSLFLLKQSMNIKRRLLGKITKTKTKKFHERKTKCGNYNLIYPNNNVEKYNKHLLMAERAWNETMQGKKIAEKLGIAREIAIASSPHNTINTQKEKFRKIPKNISGSMQGISIHSESRNHSVNCPNKTANFIFPPPQREQSPIYQRFTHLSYSALKVPVPNSHSTFYANHQAFPAKRRLRLICGKIIRSNAKQNINTTAIYPNRDFDLINISPIPINKDQCNRFVRSHKPIISSFQHSHI